MFFFAVMIDPIDTQAGYNVPTAVWNLFHPDGVSAAEAAAMHVGHYSFSAYINHYKLYSNYYFHVLTDGRYVINCNEMYNVNDAYKIGMINKYSGYGHYEIVGANQHGLYFDFSGYAGTLLQDAYFCIDGTYGSGAHVSIVGYVDTY